MVRESKDKPDVLTFRRVDRAEAAVVRRMHVAHFEAGALASETAWAERRERAHVLEFGKNVLLIHKLRKLVGGEKFMHRCLERTRINKRHRERCFGLRGRHPVLNIALHAAHADAHARLQKFADETHAAETEMVDVVWRAEGSALNFAIPEIMCTKSERGVCVSQALFLSLADRNAN